MSAIGRRSWRTLNVGSGVSDDENVTPFDRDTFDLCTRLGQSMRRFPDAPCITGEYARDTGVVHVMRLFLDDMQRRARAAQEYRL